MSLRFKTENECKARGNGCSEKSTHKEGNMERMKRSVEKEQEEAEETRAGSHHKIVVV